MVVQKKKNFQKIIFNSIFPFFEVLNIIIFPSKACLPFSGEFKTLSVSKIVYLALISNFPKVII